MHPRTARALARLGVSAGEFRTRRLTVRDVEQADLILTAGAEHQDQVVGLVSDASRRTFRLREFAWLTSSAPASFGASSPGGPVEAVAQVARRRGRVPGQPPGDGELPDPVHSDEAVLDAARVIEEAVRQVLDVISPARLTGRPTA